MAGEKENFSGTPSKMNTFRRRAEAGDKQKGQR